MFRKILNTLFLLIFTVFIFFVSKYYFSEKNIIITNKSRSSYSLEINEINSDLPVLKSDTKNIIIYKDGLEDYKKKRKKWIWEDLVSSKNE